MAASSPLVTIGVPVYNGAKYLQKALDALLAQDYSNFEVVISDNASTDGSLAMLEQYAARDSRVHLEVQSSNIGAIGNFTNVLRRARGEYFMWAAVDDFWYPAFVRSAVEQLEAHPDAGVAMSAIDRVWESGELFDEIRYHGANEKNHHELVLALTSPEKYNLFVYGLFRTELLRAAMPFVPQVPAWERLLMCQIALASTFRYIDEVLHLRMHHPTPSHVRLPDEKFNKLQTQERWVTAKILLAYARMLARSSIVPAHRKLYAPQILQRYGWLLVRSQLVGKIQDQLGSRAWEHLGPVRKIVRRGLART